MFSMLAQFCDEWAECTGFGYTGGVLDKRYGIEENGGAELREISDFNEAGTPKKTGEERLAYRASTVSGPRVPAQCKTDGHKERNRQGCQQRDHEFKPTGVHQGSPSSMYKSIGSLRRTFITVLFGVTDS
jgi:hypothetical protein